MVIILILTGCTTSAPIQDEENIPDTKENAEEIEFKEEEEDSDMQNNKGLPQLKVSGNKIVLADDENKMVWLTGLNLGGSNWVRSLYLENIPQQIDEIIANWNINIIRLPISLIGWYGHIRHWEGDEGNADEYQRDIKNIVKKFNDAGIYVIFDLHEFYYPAYDYEYAADNPDHPWNNHMRRIPGVIDFWTQIATDEFYANNPGVLFGIFNEHYYSTPDVYESWDIWRNGGFHHETDHEIVGHQKIIETIRDLGAKNIILAGGLDWANDLSGIAGVATPCGTSFALEDRSSDGDPDKTGDGIVYDAHIYPWSWPNWDHRVGEARKLYPVLIGEAGYDPNDGTQVQFGSQWTMDRHEEWATMFFDWVNDVDGTYGSIPAHWTAWCFHTSASPRILADWDFTPTEFWGAYVKEQLFARDYSQY
jgi:hypothetical protein